MSKLGDIYRDMAKRSERLSGVSPRVHRILTDHQRTVMVGQERNLGPSLENPNHRNHIFRVTDDGFEFGTSVVYSRAHAAYRQRNGQRSHMRIPRRVLRSIAKVIAQYHVRGRT